MKRRGLWGLIVFVAACNRTTAPVPLSIQQGPATYLVELRSVSDSLHILSTRKTDHHQVFSEWKLRYPVYSLQTGDVDADGTDDILVGVIKKTRYDKHVRKRLFIFKLVDGLIRPLWLGSRVAHPLCAFRYSKKQDQALIITIEKEKENDKYLVAEYRWNSFGLEFIRYVKRDTGYVQAEQQMQAL